VALASSKNAELKKVLTGLSAQQVQKRQLSKLDTGVVTFLLATVINLVESVLGHVKNAPVVGGVTNNLPAASRVTGSLGSVTGKLGGRSERRQAGLDASALTSILSVLVNLLDTVMVLTSTLPGVSVVTEKLPINPATSVTSTLGSLGGRPEKCQPTALNATALLPLVVDLLNLASKMTTIVLVVGGTTSKIRVKPAALMAAPSLGGLPVP
jgi:hypothetical protein